MTQYDPRRDFNGDARLLPIAAIAAVIGVISTGTAWLLLHAINFFTNLFFFQTISDAFHSPAAHTLGAWVIAVPVIGGLIIGVIARFGSEQIRGHGIPEAIEAILFKRSAMAPIVALPGETCRTVAIRLAVHDLERVPVVADAASRRLIGVISRSDLIKASLTLHEEENTRHRFRRLSLRPAARQNGA